MVEKMVYSASQQRGGYELRWYEPCWLAQVRITGSIEQAANMGFGPLVNYIGGFNQSQSKLAMTAPVLQDIESTREHVVSFVLPSSTSSHAAPVPSDPRVQVTHVAARVMAVSTYRGRWTEQKFEAARDALLAALARDGVRPTGSALWARYDPPWTPPFLRTNEVLVPVEVAPTEGKTAHD